jgi:predicted MFS family arabinose efflux permease
LSNSAEPTTEPASSGPVQAVEDGLAALRERAESVVGGPARLRVILLLASILALNTADFGTVGAMATELEKSLRIGNFEIGLLVTVSTGVGALASLPAGVLTDRTSRVRLLSVGIALWSAAMIVSGLSTGFGMLLITRLVLGAFVAIAGPAVASLTGDLFPASERGRIYGYVLAGELVGTAFGLLLPGTIAGALSWRWGFGILAVPGFLLAAALWKLLPEPARGGQSRLLPGAEEILPAEAAAEDPVDSERDISVGAECVTENEVVRQVEARHIPADKSLVLDRNPAEMSTWQAFHYLMRIRTNVLLIVSSALGYFFLNGLQTFAVPYLRGQYQLGQSTASVLLVAIGGGAFFGVLVAGRAADGLIARRHTAGRVITGAVAFLLAAVLFLPGLLVPRLFIAMPLFFLAAAALGGTNPPLDAARLDIMHSGLWGRAESVRTALRSAVTALAPLLFGLVSELFGAPAGGLGAEGASDQSGKGLGPTFLVMLVPLAAAGAVMLRGDRSYLRDVKTAAEYERRTSREAARQASDA